MPSSKNPRGSFNFGHFNAIKTHCIVYERNERKLFFGDDTGKPFKGGWEVSIIFWQCFDCINITKKVLDQSIYVKRHSLLSLRTPFAYFSILSFKGIQFSFPVFSLRKIHQVLKFAEIWWLTLDRIWNLAFLPIFNFYKPTVP